ncbi:unnamed protein product [Adineta steineri]|uniref:AttH domain-containing protein n=1 Tax=Adineta steineri TaxID=433720 RepID=A0A814YT00_9BILA|nr:unnamed protein product [Adineta steineri]CAF3807185.1 unnamed protein product [Adineta steineri]
MQRLISAFVLVLVGVSYIFVVNAIIIPGNGVLQPGLHYQRYRQNEYKEYRPYYQWWYYWLRDTVNDRHFAIAYGTTLCHKTDVKSCVYDGAAVSFSVVDNKQNYRMQKYEFYDRNRFTVNGTFNFKILSDTNETLFEIIPLNDDKFQIRGHMKKENVNNVWVHEGCPKDIEIEWDLTLTRIYGWYAQDIFEGPDRFLEGVIMWNTYSHTAEVEGKLTIKGNDVIIKKDAGFRAYGDGNWGELMPSSPPKQKPSAKYAWGWYYVNIPSDDTFQELSIIAGTGLSYMDAILRTMDGRFCDIRLDGKTHIELRTMEVWDMSFESCNDGKVHRFDVERSNWVNFTDSFGNATIPLRQLVTLESDSYLITMDFNAVANNFNRLLFAFTDYVFSDFEGLGVSTDLLIIEKTTGKTLRNETLKSGGVEYGYLFDITVPPLPK